MTMTQQQNKLWLWADWPAPKHVRAGTSLRIGGVSENPYSDFNLANHVGDKPDNVKTNRETLIRHLNLQEEPVWLNQTHSSSIISIDSDSSNRNADASYATTKNRICAVMTADCVPLLFCNKEGTKVAAIHAGWKGICNGIIENAIQIFSNPDTILVWIGPCISADYYEVGNDVYDGCLNHSKMLKSAFKPNRSHHWHADLNKIVKILLENSGVGSIYECGLCTFEMDNLFYSYRRDGMTGRTASLIWME